MWLQWDFSFAQLKCPSLSSRPPLFLLLQLWHISTLSCVIHCWLNLLSSFTSSPQSLAPYNGTHTHTHTVYLPTHTHYTDWYSHHPQLCSNTHSNPTRNGQYIFYAAQNKNNTLQTNLFLSLSVVMAGSANCCFIKNSVGWAVAVSVTQTEDGSEQRGETKQSKQRGEDGGWWSYQTWEKKSQWGWGRGGSPVPVWGCNAVL